MPKYNNDDEQQSDTHKSHKRPTTNKKKMTMMMMPSANDKERKMKDGITCLSASFLSASTNTNKKLASSASNKESGNTTRP
jgi:hypothetical protein